MKTLRIALGGISHETNTFAIDPTGHERFEAAGILRGDAIRAEHATAQTMVAGFLSLEREPGVALVPLLFTAPNPSGTIVADAFERVCGELVRAIADGGPWDAVLLALHGAAVVEGVPQADGEIVARVRAVVGPDVPIGVTLDLHANLGPRLVEHADVVTVFRTNPHVDARERAVECGRLVIAAARGEVRPTMAMVQVPAVIGILRQATAAEPMRTILGELDTVLAEPGILSASIAQGFPYADVPEMGMAALAVTDRDAALARRAAARLAGTIWTARDGFTAVALSPDEALRTADASEQGPVLLLDVGDNIGGGSPGDHTLLLEAAIRLGVQGFLAILFDPAAVGDCVAAGPGGRVSLVVGGHLDPRGGAPVPITGRVRALTDGRYEDPTPTHGGYRFFDAGTCAVVETDGGQTVLLTSRLVMPISLEQLRSAGVSPERLRVIAAKGVVSPRAAYDRVAPVALLVDTPGVTAADPMRFDHLHRRRPLFPWEPDATLPPLPG